MCVCNRSNPAATGLKVTVEYVGAIEDDAAAAAPAAKQPDYDERLSVGDDDRHRRSVDADGRRRSTSVGVFAGRRRFDGLLLEALPPAGAAGGVFIQ